MHSITKTFLVSLLAVSASFALQQNPPAQQKPESPEATTVIRTTTRLVIVDVVAKNSKGQPVTNLKAEDFIVLENGKPQQVRIFNFQSRTTSEAKAVKPVQPIPTIAPDIITNIPRYQTTGALNIILMDGLNTALPRQAYVRDTMISVVKDLPDDVPIAVYTLGQKLRLVQDFTDDHETLKKVVSNLHGNLSNTMQNPSGSPAQNVPGSFAQVVPGEILQKMQEFERESNVTITAARMRTTLGALNAIARSVAAFPGRKNLIWIADSFPLYVNTSLTLKPVMHEDARDFGYAVSNAANTLMDSQIVIYPVDAHGLQVPAFYDIGLGKPDDAVGGRPPGANYGPAALGFMSRDFNNNLSNHEVMNQLAEDTGGKAFYYKNDLDGLVRESINDGSTYYTLGYYPADKNWDGKFRKIQVKTERSGISLHYRKGYYALNPAPYIQANARQHEVALLQALDLNSPMSTGLPFKAKVLTPAESPDKITVNFAIDPRALTFDKNEAGLQTASVDCMVQVYKDANTTLKLESTSIHAELTPENFERISKTFFPCQQTVSLPAGNYILRLGVIDNRTGLIGTATTTTKVQ